MHVDNVENVDQIKDSGKYNEDNLEKEEIIVKKPTAISHVTGDHPPCALNVCS